MKKTKITEQLDEETAKHVCAEIVSNIANRNHTADADVMSRRTLRDEALFTARGAGVTKSQLTRIFSLTYDVVGGAIDRFVLKNINASAPTAARRDRETEALETAIEKYLDSHESINETTKVAFHLLETINSDVRVYSESQKKTRDHYGVTSPRFRFVPSLTPKLWMDGNDGSFDNVVKAYEDEREIA